MWRAGAWLRWLAMAARVWGGAALPRAWMGANQMFPWRPGGRMGAASAALDGRLYMFGGGTALKAPKNWIKGLDDFFYRVGGDVADTALLGEMMFFDVELVRWIAVPVVGDEQPEARADHGLASLPSTGKLVLFGGLSRTSVLDDVWTFEPGFARWRREASGPVARTLHGFCAGDTAVYLYGGVALYSQSDAYIFQDLWMVSPDLTWTRLSEGASRDHTPLVNHPGHRLGAGMASEGDRVFIFGGCVSTYLIDCLVEPDKSFLSDVWAFDLASAAGAWDSAPGLWAQLSGAWSDSSSSPSPRSIRVKSFFFHNLATQTTTQMLFLPV